MPKAKKIQETSPCAPRWEPQRWNGALQGSNNCYAYAANDCRERSRFPQPGGKSGLSLDEHERLNVQQRICCIEKDGLMRAWLPVPKPGHYLVALAVEEVDPAADEDEAVDYHWWRQDSDGFWSHKPGNESDRRTDESGEPITDPRTCDRGEYKLFIGYFYVPEGGIRVESVNDHGSRPRHSIPLPQPRFR